jgi:hypothetical protein
MKQLYINFRKNFIHTSCTSIHPHSFYYLKGMYFEDVLFALTMVEQFFKAGFKS